MLEFYLITMTSLQLCTISSSLWIPPNTAVPRQNIKPHHQGHILVCGCKNANMFDMNVSHSPTVVAASGNAKQFPDVPHQIRVEHKSKSSHTYPPQIILESSWHTDNSANKPQWKRLLCPHGLHFLKESKRPAGLFSNFLLNVLSVKLGDELMNTNYY